MVFFTHKEDPTMARRRGHNKEQILAALRHAESEITVAEVCRDVGISEQTYYRWRNEYGGRPLHRLQTYSRIAVKN